MPQSLRETLEQTGRGVRWLSVAALGPILSRGVTLVVIARLVSPESFGIYTALLVAVGLAEMIGQFGVGAALVQTKELTPRKETAAFLVSLSLGLLIGAILYLGAAPLAALLGAEEGARPLAVMSLVFPLSAAGSVSVALLQRDFRFRVIAGWEVAGHSLGYLGVGIATAWMGFEVWALVWALMTRTLVTTVGVLFARPASPASPRRADFREILHYGGGLTFARFANYSAIQGDKLIAARELGTVAVGLYGRAYELMALPASLLGQILDRATFPVLARIQDDHAQLSQFLRLSVRWGFGVLAPLSVLVAGFADHVTALVLGGEWDAAAPALATLAYGMAFRACSKVPDSLLRAVGLVYRRAWIQWVYAAMVVVGSLIGSARGIEGIALGVVVAVASNYLMLLVLCASYTRSSYTKLAAAHLPGAVAAAVTSGAVIAIRGF